MILLLRDKCAIQPNTIRNLVVTVQHYEVPVLAIIVLLTIFVSTLAFIFLVIMDLFCEQF